MSVTRLCLKYHELQRNGSQRATVRHMTQPLPAHVQAILDGDFGVDECFEIMRAARIKAEHEFARNTNMGSSTMADAVHGLFMPLNDLSDEIESQLRQLRERLGASAA